jgi:hypothetical protein
LGFVDPFRLAADIDDGTVIATPDIVYVGPQ